MSPMYNYGIDWDGPVPLEEDTVDIPPTSSPLTDEQLAEFDSRTASLWESSITDDKLKLYRLAREFLEQHEP